MIQVERNKVYKFTFDLQPGSLTVQVAGEHQPYKFEFDLQPDSLTDQVAGEHQPSDKHL